MARKHILRREPFRGGQICGEQLRYATPEFCGYRKAEDEFFCRVHARSYRLHGDPVNMAAGNARGDSSQPLELSFEPFDGITPLLPTEDELQAWRAGFDHDTLRGCQTMTTASVPEPDLDRRLSLAMRLLAMTETELNSEAPRLRKRISDALEYMDEIANPNTHTLAHVRRYLEGAYEAQETRHG